MSKKNDNPNLVIKNLPFVVQHDTVTELHKDIREAQIHRGYAFVFLKEGADVSKVIDELDGAAFQGRALSVVAYEDRPREERRGREGDRGRSNERGRHQGRERSRSSSQGRGGPRRPRVVPVRSGVMILRIPSTSEFLEGFSFTKNEEKNLISSGLNQPPVKGALGFDPAILVSPKEKKAKAHSTTVIHKRLFAITDSTGSIWSRTSAAKEEAEKSLVILQEAGLDTKNLLLMRFEGEAILQSLTPLQVAIGRFFNKEEVPMGIESIQQVTSNSTEISLFSLRKWNSEEEVEEN